MSQLAPKCETCNYRNRILDGRAKMQKLKVSCEDWERERERERDEEDQAGDGATCLIQRWMPLPLLLLLYNTQVAIVRQLCAHSTKCRRQLTCLLATQTTSSLPGGQAGAQNVVAKLALLTLQYNITIKIYNENRGQRQTARRIQRQ